MSGYKYVPDGVFLACNQGTETSNLKITHVKNAHLYNNQLYATDRDVEPVNIGCFGNCRELNTKCKYQKGIWQKVHPTLSVEGAAPILDEISYLECPYKGKITIHFDKASAEAIANKNATEKDGINWGRIGNHLLDKGKGLLQGALLGVAIVGGCALIGGVIGFFGGGGVGAVPGAVAGAKVGMAILTGLGIAATVKSVSDTYKSGERLIESTNKAEDGIIFAIDLSETIIMMLGLKKGIKNFKKNSSKVGEYVGGKINKYTVKENNILKYLDEWGINGKGENQGQVHFNNYWEQYPDRIPSLEKRLGLSEGTFSDTPEGFINFTKQAKRITTEATENNIRESNGKKFYYMEGIEKPKKGVVVIVKDEKLQSMMPSDPRSFSKLK